MINRIASPGLWVSTSAFQALVGLMLGLMTTTALAGDESAWEYEFTPYAWAAGLDGTIGFSDRRGDGIKVDQSFSDIMDRLDLGLMGAFEARNGRWALLLDGVYFKVSDRGTLRGPADLADLSGDASVTQQLYALAGAYRVNEDPSQLVDVVGGVRYNSVKWNVKLSLFAPDIVDVQRRFAKTESWTDPYFGVRLKQALGDRWSLLAYGDIGGLGLGSDLSWQLIGGTAYAFNPNLVGKFGYRHVHNDYDEDGFEYDMASSGLYLGLGFRW